MLTGQGPIKADTLQQILFRKVTEESPLLLSLRPDLPTERRAVIG